MSENGTPDHEPQIGLGDDIGGTEHDEEPFDPGDTELPGGGDGPTPAGDRDENRESAYADDLWIDPGAEIGGGKESR